MKFSKYNVVIIGSGLSGLFLANKLLENKNLKDGIALITKSKLNSGSTPLAQGGIVSVIPEINKKDSIELHVKDTLRAGCGLNNINTVNFVSQQSSLAIQELMRFGVQFDKLENNQLSFTLEGAHSCPRILHAKGDSTGRVIENALCERLIQQSNVDIFEDTVAVEILTDLNNECKGVVVYNKNLNSFETIYSSCVVIATGGIGQIYDKTTNPVESTGDGIAIAYRAGAMVENMEFVQFHPTALYCKNKQSLPLVSESTRGEGAKLVDLNGNYFAKNYHNLADLAPRDVVSRAIKDQMDANGFEYVNLDISQIGIEKFKQRFPTITSLCNENNISLDDGLIPVHPAQHYFMGGIKVDCCAKTNIKNLYAVGECSSTGLHGANRLASNSLLECVVFARKLAQDLLTSELEPPKKNDSKVKEIIDKYIDIDCYCENVDLIKDLFNSLKEYMTCHVGIIRTKKSLNLALCEIDRLENELNLNNLSFSFEKYEFLNALTVARLIAKASLNREESIGAHYRSDSISQTKSPNKGEILDDKILVK